MAKEAELIEKLRSVVFKESESLEGVSPNAEGYNFNQGLNCPPILKSLGLTGFQAAQLGDAFKIVNQMVEWRLSHEQVTQDCSEEEKNPTYRESVKCKIFLGFTSNIISPGVGDNIRHLVQHRLVDVLVTKSGGIAEDILKFLAEKSGADFSLPGVAHRKLEDWIVPILDKMSEEQTTEHVVWTPSRVIARLGKEINNESSYLYWAYKNNIPVYCLDGCLWKMLHFDSIRNPALVIDFNQEYIMLNNEALHAKPRKTGMIILGGDANMMCNRADYEVIIDTFEECKGSYSGARFDDVSWGKISASAKSIKVHCNATIAFPLLVTATFGKIQGHEYNQGLNFSQILNPVPSTGFPVSDLADAIDIVNQMLEWRLSHDQVAEDCSEEEKNPTYRESVRCKIFLGFTSNLISSGVRDIIRYLAQHRMVDVIVTTTGGIEEDIIKCLANTYKGDFSLPGATLRSKGLNRIGNLLVPNDNYCKFEDWVIPILNQMLEEQNTQHVLWTPSKVIARLGKEISNESSYLYWAYKNGIPVFCPGLTDGSLGDMLYFHSFRYSGLIVDVVQDIKAMNSEAVHANPRKTGMIILGGGIAKHHICNANMMRNGADYAVFINTAREFDGSDSGARPDEAVSWGKIRASAKSVKVHCDATIAFPILVAETFATKREEQLGRLATTSSHG